MTMNRQRLNQFKLDTAYAQHQQQQQQQEQQQQQQQQQSMYKINLKRCSPASRQDSGNHQPQSGGVKRTNSLEWGMPITMCPGATSLIGGEPARPMPTQRVAPRNFLPRVACLGQKQHNIVMTKPVTPTVKLIENQSKDASRNSSTTEESGFVRKTGSRLRQAFEESQRRKIELAKAIRLPDQQNKSFVYLCKPVKKVKELLTARQLRDSSDDVLRNKHRGQQHWQQKRSPLAVEPSGEQAHEHTEALCSLEDNSSDMQNIAMTIEQTSSSETSLPAHQVSAWDQLSKTRQRQRDRTASNFHELLQSQLRDIRKRKRLLKSALFAYDSQEADVDMNVVNVDMEADVDVSVDVKAKAKIISGSTDADAQTQTDASLNEDAAIDVIANANANAKNDVKTEAEVKVEVAVDVIGDTNTNDDAGANMCNDDADAGVVDDEDEYTDMEDFVDFHESLLDMTMQVNTLRHTEVYTDASALMQPTAAVSTCTTSTSALRLASMTDAAQRNLQIDMVFKNIPTLQQEIKLLQQIGERLEATLRNSTQMDSSSCLECESSSIYYTPRGTLEERPAEEMKAITLGCLHVENWAKPLYTAQLYAPVLHYGFVREFRIETKTLTELKTEDDNKCFFYLPNNDKHNDDLRHTSFRKLKENPNVLLQQLRPMSSKTAFNLLDHDPCFLNSLALGNDNGENLIGSSSEQFLSTSLSGGGVNEPFVYSRLHAAAQPQPQPQLQPQPGFKRLFLPSNYESMYSRNASMTSSQTSNFNWDHLDSALGFSSQTSAALLEQEEPSLAASLAAPGPSPVDGNKNNVNAFPGLLGVVSKSKKCRTSVRRSSLMRCRLTPSEDRLVGGGRCLSISQVKCAVKPQRKKLMMMKMRLTARRPVSIGPAASTSSMPLKAKAKVKPKPEVLSIPTPVKSALPRRRRCRQVSPVSNSYVEPKMQLLKTVLVGLVQMALFLILIMAFTYPDARC